MSIRNAALALVLICALCAPEATASVGIGSTLPSTCAAGDTFSQTSVPALDFECLGTNTWRPRGPSRILAIRKGININSANTDFAMAMPSVRYLPRSIVLTGATVSLAGSAARLGVWTLAGGTGVNIVPASAMTGLTTSATWAEVNLSVSITSSLTTVFARCTVAHGSAATVDAYIMGDLLP